MRYERRSALFGLGCLASVGACSSSEPATSDGGPGGTVATSGDGGPVSGTVTSSSVGGATETSTSGTALTSTTTLGSGGATSGAATSTASTGAATGTGGVVSTTVSTTGSGGSTTGVGGGATVGGTATDGSVDPQDPGKPPLQPAGEPIFFGTTLDATAVMTDARALAQSQANPSAPSWRATGDQHRTYHFDETNQDEPYRLYVPADWDGESRLPLVMFLHGAGSNENTYVDQNNQLMLNLAQEHGFLLVSAMGADGAYGNFLRLSAPFGNQQGAADLMAQVTPESELVNELSEQDVINVLELVLEEYPIDTTAMFLTGHSMGSGGAWYIGGKYSVYWRAIAPMSGPFVQETGYPWDNLRDVSILVTEGTQTPSLDGSRLLGDWLVANGFDAEYEEVDADHGGMVPLVLPDVFDFFDSARSN